MQMLTIISLKIKERMARSLWDSRNAEHNAVKLMNCLQVRRKNNVELSTTHKDLQLNLLNDLSTLNQYVQQGLRVWYPGWLKLKCWKINQFGNGPTYDLLDAFVHLVALSKFGNFVQVHFHLGLELFNTYCDLETSYSTWYIENGRYKLVVDRPLNAYQIITSNIYT